MKEKLIPFALLLGGIALLALDAWHRDVAGIVFDAIMIAIFSFWIVGDLIGWAEPR